MIATGLNLVMTVIGFAVSTMFIVFVCTRLVCARIHLRNSRMASPAAAGSDLGIVGSYSLERGIRGLEPVVVASFPTMKFGDQSLSFRQETQCAVCLADYQDKELLRILPFCGHTFHVTCIDIWLNNISTCPVCRISLRDSPDNRKRAMPPAYSPAIRSFSPESLVSDPCQRQFVPSVGTAENQRIVSSQEV